MKLPVRTRNPDLKILYNNPKAKNKIRSDFMSYSRKVILVAYRMIKASFYIVDVFTTQRFDTPV